MAKRLIRVSSRALGFRVGVRVYVYDSVEEMQAAAAAFNGNVIDPRTEGVTQAWTDQNGRTGAVLVRLARGCLGTRVVTHELHHASTALYGAAVADRPSRRAHLNHHNEPFAHLFSDLCHHLVDRLYELGYYTPHPEP